MLENNFYLVKKVKRDKGSLRKSLLPQVYIKQTRYEIQVSFILEGNKFQDRFLNLGSTLEVMFNGDFRDKSFDKRFIKYEIAINRIESRITIDEVEVKGSKTPAHERCILGLHRRISLLIGGGTGGGKTVALMSIIYALVKSWFCRYL